ncbi:hypothetical protein [Adhaeretor mobilis]|uniref:hypothetical protein n=1 Tax=Adhaeretor mobilis TaxID=1930276 RepID=UPI0011A1965A|nr:hypothetical protein [Adhaeretor mobilis]
MQFSLARLLVLTTVVAVVAFMFATIPWPPGVAFLAFVDMLVMVVARSKNKRRLRIASAVTVCLIVATLFFTDWGVSSPKPVIRIAWPPAIGAIIAQLATLGLWLMESPDVAPEKKKGDHVATQ